MIAFQMQRDIQIVRPTRIRLTESFEVEIITKDQCIEDDESFLDSVQVSFKEGLRMGTTGAELSSKLRI